MAQNLREKRRPHATPGRTPERRERRGNKRAEGHTRRAWQNAGARRAAGGERTRTHREQTQGRKQQHPAKAPQLPGRAAGREVDAGAGVEGVAAVSSCAANPAWSAMETAR